MIGQMKDRIKVVHINKIDNGRGGFQRREVEIGTFWGSIEEQSARNIVEYRQDEMRTNTRIIMRKDSRITRKCVLYARETKFEIEEIIDEGSFINILAVGEKIG
jgi:hypothetical protein